MIFYYYELVLACNFHISYVMLHVDTYLMLLKALEKKFLDFLKGQPDLQPNLQEQLAVLRQLRKIKKLDQWWKDSGIIEFESTVNDELPAFKKFAHLPLYHLCYSYYFYSYC